jgi:hypothetical protein
MAAASKTGDGTEINEKLVPSDPKKPSWQEGRQEAPSLQGQKEDHANGVSEETQWHDARGLGLRINELRRLRALPHAT